MSDEAKKWAEIALKNGLTKEIFRKRVKLDWDFKRAATAPKRAAKKRKTYALYRGENIIAIGTLAEIAAQQGIQEETVRRFGTPDYAKRVTENGRRLILLEDDDE